MSDQPLVVDIHRNALDDGPGIRTTVFFKGCVLRCVWCQNPETLSPNKELQRSPALCIACKACEEHCPRGAVRFDSELRHYDPTKCSLCGACAESCPPGGIRLLGTPYTIDELIEPLVADEPFYRHSGGGVTWSGGEATMHLAFVAEASRRLRSRGIHVLLQTCGLVPWERFHSILRPHLDMIWFDLKLADPDAHERYTGVTNGRILENLRNLASDGDEKLLVRIPLVPGITDTDDNLRGATIILKQAGLRRVAVLPYNPLWIPKRVELGLPLPYRYDQFMTRDEQARCRATLEREGIEVV